MFLKRLRLMREIHGKFKAGIEAGKSPEEVGEQIEAEYQAAGLDIQTIMEIIAFIRMLIELFTKK